MEKIWSVFNNYTVFRAYSIYYRRWLENFDPSQILHVDGTDMLTNPAKWTLKVQVSFMSYYKMSANQSYIPEVKGDNRTALNVGYGRLPPTFGVKTHGHAWAHFHIFLFVRNLIFRNIINFIWKVERNQNIWNKRHKNYDYKRSDHFCGARHRSSNIKWFSG